MPNPENIEPHQFKKGQSGNPAGRPKKIPELNKLLAEVLGDNKDGVTAMQKIIEALEKKAKEGDVRAAEVLLNRAYGQPNQDITVRQEQPLYPPLTDIPEPE